MDLTSYEYQHARLEGDSTQYPHPFGIVGVARALDVDISTIASLVDLGAEIEEAQRRESAWTCWACGEIGHSTAACPNH